MGSNQSSDDKSNQNQNTTTLLSTNGTMLPDYGSSEAPSKSGGDSGNVESPTKNPMEFSYDTSISSDLLVGQSGEPNNTTSVYNPLLLDNNNNATSFSNNTTTSNDFKLNLFGNDYYPSKWLTLSTLYSLIGPLSSLAMIIGCVIPYVPQYITIYKKRDCSGFSTFVCLTLLLSNISRIAFWFGHYFEEPLIIQSILQIFAQIMLLELCVRTKQRPYKTTRSLLDCRYFWRWTNLSSYLVFLILFSALLAVAMYLLIDCVPFVETVGFLGLVTESMLGLPQVIKNYKNKSVVGMSLLMVLMWLAGDLFKTGYYIARDSPYQFCVCGVLQITIDVLILFQVCLYRQNAPIKNVEEDMPEEMAARYTNQL